MGLVDAFAEAPTAGEKGHAGQVECVYSRSDLVSRWVTSLSNLQAKTLTA